MKVLDFNTFNERFDIDKINIKDVDLNNVKNAKLSFNKDTLRSGMIVKTRNGYVFGVVKPEDFKNKIKRIHFLFNNITITSLKGMFFYVEDDYEDNESSGDKNGFMSINSYNDDLTFRDSDWNIVAIYDSDFDVNDIDNFRIKSLNLRRKMTPVYKKIKR